MKRMSDFLDLPISRKGLRVFTSTVKFDIDLPEAEAAIAHAINRVDALADALNEMIKAHSPLLLNDEMRNAKNRAEEALKAYRGEE